MTQSPDVLLSNDNWSDLRQYRHLPEIDHDRLCAYRTKRLQEQMHEHDVAAMVIVNPVSLRYAVDYSTCALSLSLIPSTYLFMAPDGSTTIHGAFANSDLIDKSMPVRLIAYFDGGDKLADNARLLAYDLVCYLGEIGTDNRWVVIEYVNPSMTQACLQRGLEVMDVIVLSERARLIKSSDEIECIKWAVAVAELGMAKMKQSLRLGVIELQLWGLLNYTNLANHGEWHDGCMLASGPRINPWLQEASQRVIESGDLVGFDTDMVGPFGYFCDISRTFHCGPVEPTKRQKEIYRLAHEEVQHNVKLIRAGITFHEIQQQSFPIPEELQENAYPCIVHGVGMCDEYPKIDPLHHGFNPYDGKLEAGMVVAVESYMGRLGEREGVKLEEQVLVTEDGCELLSYYPMEEALLN